MRAVLSKFLAHWVHSCELVHVRGVTASHAGVELASLGLRFQTRWDLPDVVAWSGSLNRMFLIEAAHRTGGISPIRRLELERLTAGCTADIIYVTAFLDRDTYRKFAPDIAWETEVWIADAPDHLIHFDGHKFLGPYKTRT